MTWKNIESLDKNNHRGCEISKSEQYIYLIAELNHVATRANKEPATIQTIAAQVQLIRK